MAQAMAKGTRGNLRYQLAKLWHAMESSVLQAVQEAKLPTTSAAGMSSSSSTSTAPTTPMKGLLTRFSEVYSQRLTTVMYMAGAAMAPNLNKAALQDRDAIEKLIVRLLPRPSARTVLVGDVIAFNSPLTPQQEASNVMVRRVAAVEGDELVASEDEDEEEILEIPKGHCWVLADNPDLKPPQVIDSRSFGHIPMSSIIGRVIYAGASVHESGPVANNPVSADQDQAIIQAEVEPELVQLFSTEGGSGGENASK